MLEKLEYPERVFSISDCHGGHKVWNPLTSPDIIEQLTQSIRSDLSEIQRFDNFGISIKYSQYIIQVACRLHKKDRPSRKTGLFINIAPRTKKDNNGQPFIRAEFDYGLSVVATPLILLSSVRDQVKKLQYLPNIDNNLYKKDEQHRSSYTLRLLANNHNFTLKEINISEIPELKPHCEVKYIDRFGNLVISGIGSQIEILRKRIAENLNSIIKLQIGVAREVKISQSLSNADVGKLVIYENDGDIEVLAKWNSKWNHKKQLDNSAYKQFGEPSIGTPVKILEVKYQK